jgi:hypothetical protein
MTGEVTEDVGAIDRLARATPPGQESQRELLAMVTPEPPRHAPRI